MDQWATFAAGTAANLLFVGLGLSVIRTYLGRIETNMQEKLNTSIEFLGKHCATVHDAVEKDLSQLREEMKRSEEKISEDKKVFFRALDSHGHKGLEGNDNRVIRESR